MTDDRRALLDALMWERYAPPPLRVAVMPLSEIEAARARLELAGREAESRTCTGCGRRRPAHQPCPDCVARRAARARRTRLNAQRTPA